MADFLYSVTESDSTLIDVGCGKGYLSLELALKMKQNFETKPNLKFILVDGQENNIESVK